MSRRLAVAVALMSAACLSLSAAIAAGAEPDGRPRIGALYVVGGEAAWHPSSKFRVVWGPPGGGASQAEVLGVHYLVEDAAGNVVVPTVHLPVPSFAIEPVEVPPIPGEYTVAVWLEGSGGDGPPVRATLRFDDTRPPPVQPPPPAGWFKVGAEISVRLPHPQGPPPPAGIRGYAVAVDRGMPQPPCTGPDVCTEGETDLAGGAEDDRLSLGQLEPGTSYVRVVAVSGSGMRSGQIETLELRVDGSPPEVHLGRLPAGWSNGPVKAQALASDSQSGMDPGDGSKALTAITVDGHPSALAPGGAVVATVHGEGLHVLTPAARDAAGNATWEEEGSPPSAMVRIDETAPRVAFAAQQDSAEPERIEASVADALSGAADDRGSIEVRLAGSRRPFAPIATTASAGTLVAVWDSDSFPPGRYEFRAAGYDAAGNRTLTTRRDGGDPMELPSPLKQATRIQLGFGGRKLTAQRCARDRGRVRCHRRQIVALDRRPARSRVRFGRSVPLAGKLITREGGRRGGEAVTVVELLDSESGASERATSVETAGDGSFFARLVPGPSRRVRLEFSGDKLHSRTASRTLRLEVAAAVTLRASTATATVGGAPVVFNGSVAPADPGHRVELQFRLPGQPWSEFRTVETDSQGRFRYAYSFSDDDSRGVRFQFRAHAPHQPGWPYAAGSSLPVVVTGR